MSSFVIYGNNTAALVAALEISKKNKVILINPGKSWGAHFSGINTTEGSFDIGMNYFEFSTFIEQNNNILEYDPKKRNDAAKYFHEAERFIKDLVVLNQVPQPLILAENKICKDFIMTNHLDCLNSLPKPKQEQVINELKAIISSPKNNLHASEKRKNETLFLNNSYKKVSELNHGKLIHETFIEPIVNKLLNVTSSEIPALFHRIAWCPLFYPETLLESFQKQSNLNDTPFFYPVKAHFSSFIDELVKKAKQNKNIQVTHSKITAIKKEKHFLLTLEDSSQIITDHFIWAADIFSLHELISPDHKKPQLKKASITLALLSTEFSNINTLFSTIYICDKDQLPYRIVNQQYSAGDRTAKKHQLVIELNLDYIESKGIKSDEQLQKYLSSYLVEANLLKQPPEQDSIKIYHLRQAITIPTLENFSEFQKIHNLTQNKFPEINLIGPSSGFVSTSLNDQIIQGLKLGVIYS